LQLAAGAGRQDRRADAQGDGVSDDDEKTRAEKRQDHKAHLENMQAVRAADFLWQIAKEAKDQLGPARWLAHGGSEAEDLLHAIEEGRPHPLLLRWEKLKSGPAANRPAPSLPEQGARRSVVLMCAALERAAERANGPGKYKDMARRRAAQAVKGVFPTDPTAKAIAHWQRAYHSPSVTSDEYLIGRAFERWGNNHKMIAEWFAGLARIALGSLRPIL
jgi:hypothetical protein